MGRVTTEAIALRRTPFGETSQIVEFFTRERGRIALIAKGVHRPRVRKGGGVDLLDHCVLTYSVRRGSRGLAQLTERRVLSHHPRMRTRGDLLVAGEYLVELVHGLVPEAQPLPNVFGLCVATLQALEALPAPSALSTVVFALQGAMLRLTGFEPVLDRCVSCDRRPEGHRTLRCDLERGGIVCSACRHGQEHTFYLSMAATRAIRSLAREDPRQLMESSLPMDVERQIRHYYDRVLVHVLERPPRCVVLQRAS